MSCASFNPGPGDRSQAWRAVVDFGTFLTRLGTRSSYAMNADAKVIYEFGPFRMDPDKQVLLREGPDPDLPVLHQARTELARLQ